MRCFSFFYNALLFSLFFLLVFLFPFSPFFFLLSSSFSFIFILFFPFPFFSSILFFIVFNAYFSLKRLKRALSQLGLSQHPFPYLLMLHRHQTVACLQLTLMPNRETEAPVRLSARRWILSQHPAAQSGACSDRPMAGPVPN